MLFEYFYTTRNVYVGEIKRKLGLRCNIKRVTGT